MEYLRIKQYEQRSTISNRDSDAKRDRRSMSDDTEKRIVDQLKSHLDDVIAKSHASSTTVFSIIGQQLLTDIAVVKEKQDETNTHLKTLNGKVATHAKELVDLKIVDTEVREIVRPVKDFDKRIRYAENKIWYIIGIGVATATIFVWIGSGWFDDIQENIQNSTKSAVIEYIDNMEFEI